MFISDHAGNRGLIEEAFNDLLICAHRGGCEYMLHKCSLSELPAVCELLQVFRQLQKLPDPSFTLNQPAQQAIESQPLARLCEPGETKQAKQ